MPLYEYQCEQCGRFELIRKFSDPVLSACPTCGREVHKLLSAPAIQFKGPGWYITDYARKSPGGDGASGTSSSKDGSGDGAAKDGAAKDGAGKDGAKGGAGKEASKDTSSGTPSASKDSSPSGSSPTK